jgi:hypothetical protein
VHDCTYGNDNIHAELTQSPLQDTAAKWSNVHGVMHGYTCMLEARTKAELFNKPWHGFAFQAFSYTEKVTLWNSYAEATRGPQPAAPDGRHRKYNL